MVRRGVSHTTSPSLRPPSHHPISVRSLQEARGKFGRPLGEKADWSEQGGGGRKRGRLLLHHTTTALSCKRLGMGRRAGMGQGDRGEGRGGRGTAGSQLLHAYQMGQSGGTG